MFAMIDCMSVVSAAGLVAGKNVPVGVDTRRLESRELRYGIDHRL
jgi:hypothetical protein